MLTLLFSLRDCFRARAFLQAEILALRHQLLVLQRSNRGHKLRLGWADRVLWVWLSRLWNDWRSALLLVKPETVIARHRQGFHLYWRWKSRCCEGRPTVSPEVQNLIRHMSLANPSWGAPRIHGELLKLGIQVSQATVAKYMVRHRKPPSQSWRTFLKNHAKDLVSADFFICPNDCVPTPIRLCDSRSGPETSDSFRGDLRRLVRGVRGCRFGRACAGGRLGGGGA